MKFVILIYQGTSMERINAMSEADKQVVYKDYGILNSTPGFSAGLPLGLPAAAKTVQIRDGKVLIKDGVFQNEGVGGYGILEAENIEAAIEIAKKIPAARLGGAIEIRPAEKYW